MWKTGFLVFVFVGLSVVSYSQKGWEVGGWIGTSLYYGDLNNEINFKSPRLAGGLLGKYNFNTRVAWRASLNYGRIAANDANSNNNFDRNRNLSFYSDIFDFTTGIEFNFLEHIHGSDLENYTPFIFVGLSVFKFNPKAELNGMTYSLQSLGTEGQDLGSEYSLISGGLTFGGGFKWDISKDVTFAAEFTTKRLLTDYLDDVSTTFPDEVRLAEQRGTVAAALSNRSLIEGLGVEGRQRGDISDKDRYTFISFSFTKYFSRLECPKISKI